MFGASLLGAGAVTYLATATPGDDDASAMTYVSALVLINLQVSVVDLLTEGKYTEKMSEMPEVSSDVVSFVARVTAGGRLRHRRVVFVLPTKNYRTLLLVLGRSRCRRSSPARSACCRRRRRRRERR